MVLHLIFAIAPSFKLLDFSADGRGIGVGCKAEGGKLKVDMPLEAQSFNGYTFDFDTENQVDTWVPVLTDKKIQHRVIGWSDWISCGTNACGITLKYRYNDGLKLCEINWDGVVNATIGGNTAGYMWTGFPTDKKPKGNIFIPVPNSLCGRRTSNQILSYNQRHNKRQFYFNFVKE